MANETILVVEDDDNILELITYHLKQAGFQVVQSFTGEEALERAAVKRPDLILLDLMLPNMSGLEVCEKLKGDPATRTIPVVIVSARGADADVITGLEAGADDYIIKPFHPPSFVTHVQSILTRSTSANVDPKETLQFQGIQINPVTQKLRIENNSVSLTELEFKILHMLALQAGRLRTRSQIRTALGLGEDTEMEFSVDGCVMSLCAKLGDYASCIEAVRRIGYRFKDEGS